MEKKHNKKKKKHNNINNKVETREKNSKYNFYYC